MRRAERTRRSTGRRLLGAVAGVLAGVVLIGGACDDGSLDDPDDFGWGSDGLTTIVDADPESVALDRGRRFGIRFESSASIGDDWVLLSSTDPSVAEIVDERVLVDDPDVEGSGGRVVFVVEGRTAGFTELTFVNCFQGACSEGDLPDAERIAEQDLDTAKVAVTVRGER